MSTAAEKFGALSQLVAVNLADIPDLPQYKTPPAGVYKWMIEFLQQKELGDKTALVMVGVIVETIEVDDLDSWDPEELVKPGDKFSEAFWFNDPDKVETTLGVMKLKFSGLAAPFGTENLLEILDKAEGCIVQSKIGNRIDKNDKTKMYAQTRDIILDGMPAAGEGAAGAAAEVQTITSADVATITVNA